MLATLSSATLTGVTGHPVTVEVHHHGGLPGFTMVGLPDTTCREARDRVRAALQSSDLDPPQQRTTVNLAPSHVRKGGAGLDLAIAVGCLVATGQLPAASVEGMAFIGELGLDGTVRRVNGTVPMVHAVRTPTVVVGRAAAEEARLVRADDVRVVATLREVYEALAGEAPWPDPPPPRAVLPPPAGPDLADVRGQPSARLALEVAAAGHHHVLMVGPPGAGKTMLATRLPGLLPDLEPSVAMDATCIHSAAGAALPAGGLIRRPPFRAPHHGASAVAMIGGGGALFLPGEISLAHGGILFLDELGEFAVDVLDSLRQPLEEGVVRVARAHHRVEFPAGFILVAAMNPCPCGEGLAPGGCRCSPAQLARYARRVSGPLLDRFDLRIPVHRPAADELLGATAPGEPSRVVRDRVMAARERARTRGADGNADLDGRRLDEVAPLTSAAEALLVRALHQARLSARGLRRVRAVALTLADLRGDDPPLRPDHVALALQLRVQPRFLAGRVAV